MPTPMARARAPSCDTMSVVAVWRGVQPRVVRARMMSKEPWPAQRFWVMTVQAGGEGKQGGRCDVVDVHEGAELGGAGLGRTAVGAGTLHRCGEIGHSRTGLPGDHQLRTAPARPVRDSIFLFAFSAALLTVATAALRPDIPAWQVWDFLVFGLLMAAGGIFGLRDRAAIVGQVLMAVGDAGIYLTEPPQCIPWPEVAGLVVFRTWQDGDDADSGTWLSQMAVVPSGEDCQPGAGARNLYSPDQCGVTVDLRYEKVRLGELSDAVHTYAPGLPVWDAGKIKSKNVRVDGR
jgi:hypothetical protein